MHVAIERLITNYERQEFYDKRATLRDLIDSISATFKQHFPNTLVKVVITGFIQQPVLISDIENRTNRSEGRPSLVIVNGTVYFLKNYIKDEIQAAMENYTQTIILITDDGKPSPGLGIISLQYSIFTGTYPCDYTVDTVNGFTSYSINSDDDTTTFSSVLYAPTPASESKTSTNPQPKPLFDNVTDKNDNNNIREQNNQTDFIPLSTEDPGQYITISGGIAKTSTGIDQTDATLTSVE